MCQQRLESTSESRKFSSILLSIDGIDKTRWSCPWNSDQNCTQNSTRGWWGVQGVGRSGGCPGGGWIGGSRVQGWVGRGIGVVGMVGVQRCRVVGGQGEGGLGVVGVKGF